MHDASIELEGAAGAECAVAALLSTPPQAHLRYHRYLTCRIYGPHILCQSVVEQVRLDEVTDTLGPRCVVRDDQLDNLADKHDRLAVLGRGPRSGSSRQRRRATVPGAAPPAGALIVEKSMDERAK